MVFTLGDIGEPVKVTRNTDNLRSWAICGFCLDRKGKHLVHGDKGISLLPEVVDYLGQSLD